MVFFKSVKLEGYILAQKTDDEGEESEEEEETVPEFLDMNEMDAVSSGAFLFQRSVPAWDEVNFMSNGKKVRLRGRFPLRNPWWKISCSAKQYNHKYVATGFPSYELRTDLKNDWRAIISLFMKEFDVDSNFVVRFMEWLPEDRHVDLRNLDEALSEFGESSSDANQASVYVRSQIYKSDAAFLVRVATSYPYIMKHLPTLLPGQFLNLLKKGKEEEVDEEVDEEEEKQQAKTDEENMEASSHKYNKVSLLARLEELIKTEVWKFGFGCIMHKEFWLIRCETTLNNFMSCELFNTMTTVQQNALKVYNELKDYCRWFGHTYIQKNAFGRKINKRLNMPEARIWDAVAFLCQHEVLKVEKDKIALMNLYNYEKKIAECLHHLILGERWKIDLDVRQVLRSAARERTRDQLAANSSSASGTNGEDESGLSRVSVTDEHEPMDEMDPDQVRAAEMMCDNAVTVISGKGGCGKTTVVSMIFKAAMEQQESRKNNGHMLEEVEQKENDDKPLEVLLTAPTGRAASLLTKKTCFTAYTIHQVLWNYKLAQKGPNGKPMNWKFDKVRVLVVDEGSLVDVQILSSILSILTKHAKLQKFIILGDIRQLPSISPGNVLNDLFTSLTKVYCAIEMRTNHRAESKLIVENASLIADMGVSKRFHHLNYDATVELGKACTLPSPEKRFIEILLPAKENDDDLQNSIKRLLNGPAPGLNDDASSQFIAFTRKECALINELCCQHYSKHTTMTHKKKKNFQIGDKVCCTKNGYVTNKDKENEAKSKKDDLDEGKRFKKDRLCNGEIFFITEDKTLEETGQKRSRDLTLDDKQGRKLTVDYRELMRECKLRHSWARTIHTFQGSEEKTIVYVLDKGNNQTWKHVYTAITRGQHRVYVIAKQGGLENAIRERVIKRDTQLEGFVMDLLKKDFLSQSQFNTPKRASSRFAHESSPSPGPSQAYSGMMSLMCSSGLGCFSSPATPSPCKREGIADSSTPSKKLKVDTPLGSSKLQRLSLNTTPKQLFPTADDLDQEQETAGGACQRP
ncbi:hypothetical protein KOW79_016252 [Hemibagrus wyckioides]|uniref:DNA helicase B winged helix domain-containing protein n=2 Tax=Hemibagrus wyckioides TaxID=337641 RepID=A0A9D3NF33_9TELE|nr:hypothetical protein KOW79_016252 [Hemibagrus wyckioides]